MEDIALRVVDRRRGHVVEKGPGQAGNAGADDVARIQDPGGLGDLIAIQIRPISGVLPTTVIGGMLAGGAWLSARSAAEDELSAARRLGEAASTSHIKGRKQRGCMCR